MVLDPGGTGRDPQAKTTVSDEEVSRVRFTAWDLIDVCNFDKGVDNMTGVERLAKLRAIPKHPLFEVVQTFEIANMEEAQDLFKKQLADGQEGIILKNNNHIWEDKRSKQCVKMKEVIEMDLKITGVVEGTGKASGMCGAIEVENGDGSIKSNVGTGMDDATRQDIWSRKADLVGTIVTVKCNGVISRKGVDSKSLFLPVFVELRLDKTESD